MASEYYVVSFDDRQGNLGRKNELTDFLKQNGFGVWQDFGVAHGIL